MLNIHTAAVTTAAFLVAGGLVTTATLVPGSAPDANASAPASQPQAGDSSQPEQVRQLMDDHLEVLREIVAAEEQQYGQGRADGGMLQVYEAKRALAQVEYEYAQSHEQRIAALESQVEIAEAAEKHAAGLAEMGRGDPTDALKWKAAALEAKVALEQAKAK